jgi:hypothetical protein
MHPERGLIVRKLLLLLVTVAAALAIAAPAFAITASASINRTTPTQIAYKGSAVDANVSMSYTWRLEVYTAKGTINAYTKSGPWYAGSSSHSTATFYAPANPYAWYCVRLTVRNSSGAIVDTANDCT